MLRKGCDILGKTSNESKAKYNAKTYDRINAAVPKGHKAVIKAVADNEGETLNQFVNKAINERVQRLCGVAIKEHIQQNNHTKEGNSNVRSV